ncbi:hypothetical protein FQR65_LT01685 [Abscondita terminalis]|nr:hypothetical protein FQR65_LT01685 [Abscondita terminalis]
MKYLLVLVILMTLRNVNGLKILGIFVHAGRSHFDVFRPLLIALAEKGHELTVLGYFPLTKKIPRYKDVVLKYPGNELKSTVTVTNLGSETIEQYFACYFAFQMTKVACDTGLSSKEYKELFNQNDEYDIILSEYFISDCFLLPFVEKTKLPVIGIQSHVLLPWNNEWVGNPYNPSYVPSSFLKKTDRMNFFDRVENTLSVLANNLFYHFYLRKFDVNIIKKHLGLSVVPDTWNTSLILTHSHFSLHKARPFVPSIVEIGGIHIPETQPLPKFSFFSHTNNMKCAVIILMCYFLISSVSTYKILGLFPYPGISHFNVFKPLLEALSQRGHELTVISFFPSTKNTSNYKDITLTHPLGDMKGFIQMSNLTRNRFEKYFSINSALTYLGDVCNIILPSPKYQEVVKAEENFDVIVSEFFMTNCMLLPFLKKSNSPFIGLKSHVMMPWENPWVGNPDNPSYIPSMFMDYTDRMTFWTRLEGSLVLVYNYIYYRWIFEKQDFELVEKYFGVEYLPSRDVLYNVSLVLVHSHFSLHGSRPYVPNVIEYGGTHIKTPKPIPKILGVFPFTGQSHFDLYAPLLEAISKNGHEITVISSFPLNDPLPRYKDVFVPIPPKGEDLFSLNDMTTSSFQARIDKYFSPNHMKEPIKIRCQSLLTSHEYQNFLTIDQQFDLIISEYFLFNCHLTPIIHKFRIPFILIQTTQLVPWVNQWVGNPNNPAYIPIWNMDYSPTMNFIERLENTLVWVYVHFYYNYILDAQEKDLFLMHSNRGPNYLDDVMYNTSLIFVNSHFTLHGPRPNVPNVIDVAGIHIKQSKQLPLHIEKWINESTHGVIYFSLGSMIKGHTFPEEKRQMFVRAFSRFPQRILWKWETDTMPGNPENIMIQKWMPQFDILSHPNVKAFLAHGGLLGVTEAVYCGLPIVAIPQFGDQFLNAKAVESAGGGVTLDYHSLNEESIYEALTTVLDSSFNKKVKQLSTRFKDRPLSPLDTAVYWVEYVARHKGAHHLKTAAAGMPYHQYLLLDVVAFMILILVVSIYVFYQTVVAMMMNKLKTKEKVN